MSIQERIEKLEQELVEIKAELSKPREEFKKGEYYWCLLDYGDVGESRWEDDNIDNFRLLLGNAFHTREEAETHKQRLIVHNKLKQIAKRLNNGIEIDWDNENNNKYCLCLTSNKDVEMCVNRKSKLSGAIYCLSANFKDIAIQEIGEEALVDYLKYGI